MPKHRIDHRPVLGDGLWGRLVEHECLLLRDDRAQIPKRHQRDSEAVARVRLGLRQAACFRAGELEVSVGEGNRVETDRH